MDAIDNLIFATLHSTDISSNNISSRYFDLSGPFGGFQTVPSSPGGTAQPVHNFTIQDKITYMSFFDHCVIEEAIRKHWVDINGNILTNGVLAPATGKFDYTLSGTTVSNFAASSTYHMFYAFLVENTRIVEIFEKVIEKYVYDEELGVAPPDVRQLLLNTESLFFKEGGCRADNIKSAIRPDVQKNRRNAYYRLFGTDLAFGEKGSAQAASFYKPKASNQEFVMLFERYLAEVYNAYRHSRATCCHSVDLNNLRELAIEIRELFECRRGDRPGGSLNQYASTNLAIEEYSTVVMMSWFTFLLTANTPIVNFLGCQSSSIGDRLHKIGEKVGIQAHTYSQAFFEMAGPAANVLALIETGTYLENFGTIQTMITSLNTAAPPSPDSELMNSFLILINAWEKATGHKLKAETQQHTPKEVTIVEKAVAKSVTRAFLN